MKKTEDLLRKAEADESYSSINQAEQLFPDEQTTQNSFVFFKRELRVIEIWNRVSNLSEFELFDESGEISASRSIVENHFIRISIKGSGKYDWVRVVKILDQPAEMVLTVKPTYDPTDPERNKEKVSHFFTAEAENNFCLVRDGLTIKFFIIGLNEHENAEQTEGIIETIRNWITANFGSYLGMQKTQWTTFAENFLELEVDDRRH
jgi:hypothetical protein